MVDNPKYVVQCSRTTVAFQGFWPLGWREAGTIWCSGGVMSREVYANSLELCVITLWETFRHFSFCWLEDDHGVPGAFAVAGMLKWCRLGARGVHLQIRDFFLTTLPRLQTRQVRVHQASWFLWTAPRLPFHAMHVPCRHVFIFIRPKFLTPNPVPNLSTETWDLHLLFSSWLHSETRHGSLWPDRKRQPR